MKAKSIFISAFIALAVITSLFAKDNPKAASYKSFETKDKSAPVVYFIRDITPEALVKVVQRNWLQGSWQNRRKSEHR